MKKLLCLLLCLMLPVAAMAAPMRAMRDSVLSEAELATMRSWLDGVVRDALPLQYDSNTYVGAYVYSCVEDGGCYVLECDVMLQDGEAIGFSPEDKHPITRVPGVSLPGTTLKISYEAMEE